MRENIDIPAPAGGSYRVPRQRDADPNTRRMALIAGGIGASLLVLVGAWSLTGAKRGGVPVVEADARPLRVKPDKAGGLEVDGKDEAIMGGAGDGRIALAPAPEAPAPQALMAQAPAAPSQVTTPAETKPAETKPAETRPASPAAPAPLVAAAIPEPKAAARPAPPGKIAPPAAGTAQVQLAALGTEQAAMVEWQRLEKKMPDILGGHRPAVLKAERDGRTFYRLRTGGFADPGQAASFCDRVKAHGAVCSVASF